MFEPCASINRAETSGGGTTKKIDMRSDSNGLSPIFLTSVQSSRLATPRLRQRSGNLSAATDTPNTLKKGAASHGSTASM